MIVKRKYLFADRSIEMMDAYQDKKYKVEYLQAQENFLQDMKQLSQTLKESIPINKRHDHLTIHLNNINKWISKDI